MLAAYRLRTDAGPTDHSTGQNGKNQAFHEAPLNPHRNAFRNRRAHDDMMNLTCCMLSANRTKICSADGLMIQGENWRANFA